MKLHRWQNQLIALFFSRFPLLTERWVKKHQPDEYGPPPWTPLAKPVEQCRVALVTTAGVHRTEDLPFNMEDKHGDPTYRLIPRDVPFRDLRITHDYYDHRDADKDLNIIFPLEHLQEFAREHIVGEVAPFHYSFMGHIDGPHVSRLLTDIAPAVARRLTQEQVDAVVLTPA